MLSWLVTEIKKLFKLTPWRVWIGLIFAAAAVIVVYRFVNGIGSVTALSDATPWGMWVGFDILAGVGLAAGGFVMAATVYIFQIKPFKPMVRMAILTAMLGYIIFIVGLVVEIGRPWNMLQTLANPNIHSPLWEVAICVMSYTTVLILEFALVVFERLGWKKLVNFHHKVTILLVTLGIMLSTLHQSTLGTLFTIAPHKMHPLWYSDMQNVHFFISCVAAGLAMVSFEAFLSYRFTKHAPLFPQIRKLLGAMCVVLLIFYAWRLFDLWRHGALPYLADGKAAALFWLESAMLVLVPVALYLRNRANLTPRRIFVIAMLAVFGFILHRFNVGVSSFQFVRDTGYFPTATEFAVTAALITAGFVAAGLAIYLFPMHGAVDDHEHAAEDEFHHIPWTAAPKS